MVPIDELIAPLLVSKILVTRHILHRISTTTDLSLYHIGRLARPEK
jgi:hypothetical protein